MLNIPNLTIDVECNRIMKRYLVQLINGVFNHIPQNKIKSIILTGSLARGEGTARIMNNSIEIYSDFDINIVTNRLNMIKYNKILRLLSKSYTNYFTKRGLLTHVDINAINESEIKKSSTIRRVECANSDKIIWGDEILSHLKYSPKLINKLDAIEYLFNRTLDLLKIHNLNNDNLKIYLLAKVILDLNTSLLAFFGDYTPSYLDRVKLIRGNKYAKIIPNAEFPELIHAFSQFKINCDFKQLLCDCQNLFQMKINDLNQLIKILSAKAALNLAKILIMELSIFLDNKAPKEIDDLILLNRYIQFNSNFFRSSLLKLNILLINPFKLKQTYKILMLKSHPKLFFHLILYCLLQSKYDSSQKKKRYIVEAYNKIKNTLDISSIRSWNHLIEAFLKTQEIVLQRFFK